MSFSVHQDARCPEVHASTLLLCDNRLLSAWFGGTKEGHPDTKIWFCARDLTNDDAQWSKARPIAQENGVPHWNPVLFRHEGADRILLFYKTGSHISSWKTMIIASEDCGSSWSQPKELVLGDSSGGRGPVKNKCITLQNGTIVAPASSESRHGAWECFTDSSSDGGNTWTRSAPVEIDRSKISGEGAIQPTLLSPSPGKLTMLTRSSSGHVLRADSVDNGETWGAMYESPLYNCNSGLDAMQSERGTWLVVHNPVNRNWGPRTPLVISKSEDQGKSWVQAVVLEDKPPPLGFTRIVAEDTGIVNDGESEFSYPAIIGDGNGGAHVSYTYERIGIKHVHIAASSLT